MKRLGASQKERDAREEYIDELNTLAATSADEVPQQTQKGRMIRRHARNTHGYQTHLFEPLRTEFSKGGFSGFLDKLVHNSLQMVADITGSSAHRPLSVADGISGHFKSKGSRRYDALQPKHEDEDFIYDAMFVSSPVHKKLMQEAEIIATKLAQMEAAKGNTSLQKTLGEAIEKLAEEYEMRIHPLTGVYIHDFQRVMREEKQLNGKQSLKCEFKVCVFLAKAELADLRGVKAKIGDPYNDDPQEAIAAGDHLKGHAPAVAPSGPAPHLS